jgi:hypothetical protein
MKKGILTVAAVVLGCGGAEAAGGFEQRFTAACGASSNLEPAVCACMSRKAESELKPDERAFVLAVLEKDTKLAEQLRGTLGLEGMMKAGTFMTKVSACAGGATP